MTNKKIISISLNSITTTIHVKDSPLNQANSTTLKTTDFSDIGFKFSPQRSILKTLDTQIIPTEPSNTESSDFNIKPYNFLLETKTPLLNPFFSPLSLMGIGMQSALKASLEIAGVENPLYFSLMNPFSGISNSTINKMAFDTKSEKVKATSEKIAKNGYEGIKLKISDGKGNIKKIVAAKSLEEGKGYKKVTQDGVEEETMLQISDKGIVITETITEQGHACFQKQLISDEIILSLIEAFDNATSKEDKELIFNQITAHAVSLKKMVSEGLENLNKDTQVQTLEAWQCVPLKNTTKEIISDITQTVLWIQEKVSTDQVIKENKELQQKADEAVVALEEIIIDLNVTLKEIKEIEIKQVESQANTESIGKAKNKNVSKKQEQVLDQIINKIIQTFTEQQNKSEIEQTKKEKAAKEAIIKAINKKLDQKETLIKKLIKKMETKIELLKEQNMEALAAKLQTLADELNNQINNNQNLAEAA